jgi:hypothetical protein
MIEECVKLGEADGGSYAKLRGSKRVRGRQALCDFISTFVLQRPRPSAPGRRIPSGHAHVTQPRTSGTSTCEAMMVNGSACRRGNQCGVIDQSWSREPESRDVCTQVPRQGAWVRWVVPLPPDDVSTTPEGTFLS